MGLFTEVRVWLRETNKKWWSLRVSSRGSCYYPWLWSSGWEWLLEAKEGCGCEKGPTNRCLSPSREECNHCQNTAWEEGVQGYQFLRHSFSLPQCCGPASASHWLNSTRIQSINDPRWCNPDRIASRAQSRVEEDEIWRGKYKIYSSFSNQLFSYSVKYEKTPRITR